MIVGFGKPDRSNQVDELSEASLVESLAAVVAGQDALDRGILLLDLVHRVIDVRADRCEFGARLDVLPAGVGGDPKNILTGVLVAVFKERGASGLVDPVSLQLALDRFAASLETIGDVLQEDQSEDDV